MEFELQKHKTCIFGIQESGKTYFAKKMVAEFKRPIVFQVNRDDSWEKLRNIYVWNADAKTDIKTEFEKFINFIYPHIEKGDIDAVFIDEADLFFSNNYDISPKMNDLVLNHRHKADGKGVALIFMTRRPQDIPTKIVESSKNLIIFKLEGFNAIQRFREIHPEIPALIEKLEYKKHNFVVKEIGKQPYTHQPI